MNKTIKFSCKVLITFALVVLCSVSLSTAAKADYVTDSANGVSYQNKITGVSIGYAWNYGAESTVTVNLSNDGDRVTNVKSSDSGLLAKKVYERVYTSKYSGTEKTSYNYCYIGVFAKKSGKYTVSFDVVDAYGNLKCTKTITVVTQYKTVKSGIASIKYAGKDAYSYYPYTNIKAGKLSVTMKKGYKLVSIERSAYDAKGEYVTTTIKNNSKLKLATKIAYTNDYTNKNNNGTVSGTIYKYDQLFPFTNITVKYINTKTQEEFTEGVTLYTINKKSTLMTP